ncbi:hypothetical protein [Kroppenstedtia guangzhouensis]|uniref:hypothetical protein n=1 Tax=Kroppenstedtia guangzhouensis TaxID=1274356 RepID=UPI001663C4CA|nr:hypothetical protein [Kroppenstedtia guangzhouensis]
MDYEQVGGGNAVIEFDEWRKKLNRGPVCLGVNDAYGRPIRQFDLVTHEDFGEEELVVVWNPLAEEYVAQSEEGPWIPYNGLSQTEIVGTAWEEQDPPQLSLDLEVVKEAVR